MLGTESLDADELRKVAQSLLEQVLEDFAQSRGREGEKLKAIILERAAATSSTSPGRARMPQLIARSGKARNAAEGSAANADEDRIRQESGALIRQQRSTWNEELNPARHAHRGAAARPRQRRRSGQTPRFPDAGAHREANTLGSKAARVSVTQFPWVEAPDRADAELVQNIE